MYEFIIAKRFKRICIICLETDEILYSPPDFIRVQHRDDLIPIKDAWNELQRKPIETIIEYESNARRK